MNSFSLTRQLCQHGIKCRRGYASRKLTNAEVRRKRCQLFGEEKARQRALVTRIEKIKVEHKGLPEECTLLMNKNLSTPFNCAMHIHEHLMQSSVVAVVNGVPWDMHRPLEEDCEIRFLHFQDEDATLSNQTFWRSCSFILGHVLETAFKDEHYIELCSFPRPDERSGSFVYDVDLKLPDWKPSSIELNTLSRIGGKLGHQDVMIERLSVPKSLAQQMFEDNRFKAEQIPSIAARSEAGNVTVYRMLDHVDISQGPLMTSTNLLNRFNITAVHEIESVKYGRLQRVQGVAIPRGLPLHYWAYEILCNRSKQLNRAVLPGLPSTKEGWVKYQQQQQQQQQQNS